MITSVNYVFNTTAHLNTFLLFIYFLAVLGLHWCTWAFSSCGAWDSHCGGVSCCRAQVLGTWVQQLWCMHLDALWHVESVWTRDWTCVPCIGGQILNHWTTREVQHFSSKSSFIALEITFSYLPFFLFFILILFPFCSQEWFAAYFMKKVGTLERKTPVYF